MRWGFLILLLMALGVGVFFSVQEKRSPFHEIADNSDVLEYQIRDEKYAVIVVQQNGMSKEEALKRAKQRAAEITRAAGRRYFEITSETQTQILQAEGEVNPFYGNMYQELIIEKDFGKEQVTRKAGPSVQSIPALRLVFTILPEAKGRSLDACKYTECKS